MTNDPKTVAALTEQLERQQDEIERLRGRPAPLRRFVRRQGVYPFPRRPWWARLFDRYRASLPQTGTQVVRTSALFDAQWYLRRYPQLQKDRLAQRDPAKHYHQKGAAQGLNPGPEFDTQWYWANYPDVRSTGINPLVHFVLYGQSEGRSGKP
jgi:hypothetical protein